ncbi:MAG: WecB/TagA/CpsF family glycosyltransferase [Lachnospiraceae bacterium]
MKDLKYCRILGTNINVTSMEEITEYIKDHLEDLRGEYICVSNVHTTVMSHDDDSYNLIQNSAAMALPDGKPLSVVSKLYGFKEANRVTGPDLMERLFQESNQGTKLRHYFYGSAPETLELLGTRLSDNYPNMDVAGMFSPPFRPLTDEEDADIVTKINETHPDIIWVGLGAPKQEKWMYDHRNKLTGVMIGVGAGFDYHAGNIKRAPMWMQKCSLEWLYRLMQDPKRLFKRYLVTNFRFIFLVLMEKFSGKDCTGKKR